MFTTAIIFMVVAAAETRPEISSLTSVTQGELTAQGKPSPVTDDFGFVFNAPMQIPALTPNPSSSLVTPAKYRTSLLRTSIHRRSLNRLSINSYAPISTAGRMIALRMTAPMRNKIAIHFYVFELCRLLC